MRFGGQIMTNLIIFFILGLILIGVFFIGVLIIKSKINKEAKLLVDEIMEDHANVWVFLGFRKKIKRNPEKIRKRFDERRGEIWYIDLP